MQSSLFVNTPWLQRHSPYIKHNRDYNVMFAAIPDPENHSGRIHKASPSSQAPWRCSVARVWLPNCNRPCLRKPDFIYKPGYCCTRKAGTSWKMQSMKKNPDHSMIKKTIT